MKFHVSATNNGEIRLSRIADVRDLATGQALIRGLLPLRQHDNFLIRRDAIRGKNPRPAEVLCICRVSPDDGSWVMENEARAIIASGKLD